MTQNPITNIDVEQGVNIDSSDANTPAERLKLHMDKIGKRLTISKYT